MEYLIMHAGLFCKAPSNKQLRVYFTDYYRDDCQHNLSNSKRAIHYVEKKTEYTMKYHINI